jgi:hypothetical protein
LLEKNGFTHSDSEERYMKIRRVLAHLAVLVIIISLLGVVPAGAAPTSQGAPQPKFTKAAAFDISPALRDMVSPKSTSQRTGGVREIRPDRGSIGIDKGYSRDGALQRSSLQRFLAADSLSIPGTLQNFEGLSNLDNFNIFIPRP